MRAPGLTRRTAAVPIAGIAALIVIPATRAAGATPAATAPASSPAVVANWPMSDGADGVMHDTSGYGNDGNLQNVAYGQADGGQLAYGFPLNAGKTSRVVVSNSASLNPTGAPFVVSLHVKFDTWPTSAIGDYDLIRKGQAADGQDWKVEIMQGGKARCYAHGSAGKVNLYSGKALSKGLWHTIVCTFKSGSTTITVDGGTTRTQRHDIGHITNSAPLSIAAKAGGSASDSDQYTGLTNNVRITSG